MDDTAWTPKSFHQPYLSFKKSKYNFNKNFALGVKTTIRETRMIHLKAND